MYFTAQVRVDRHAIARTLALVVERLGTMRAGPILVAAQFFQAARAARLRPLVEAEVMAMAEPAHSASHLRSLSVTIPFIR